MYAAQDHCRRGANPDAAIAIDGRYPRRVHCACTEDISTSTISVQSLGRFGKLRADEDQRRVVRASGVIEDLSSKGVDARLGVFVVDAENRTGFSAPDHAAGAGLCLQLSRVAEYTCPSREKRGDAL